MQAQKHRCPAFYEIRISSVFRDDVSVATSATISYYAPLAQNFENLLGTNQNGHAAETDLQLST